MGIFFKMMELQGVLLIYLAVGYFCRRWGVIKDEALDSFSSFILNVAVPCVIFNSFGMELTHERMSAAGSVMFWSFMITVASYVLGLVIFRKADQRERSILRYGTLLSNCALAGIPLVGSAFGSEAVFYASFFTIPVRILMWSFGIALFIDAPLKKKIVQVLKSPGIIAVELGLLRMLLNAYIPEVIDAALGGIGDVSTALSIIVVGAILGDIRPRDLLNKNLYYLAFVRLLLLPLLLLGAMKLTGADYLVTATCVVLVGMPIGINTVLLAQRYGADSEFASRCLFVSTLLSLITTPLLTLGL